MDPTKIAADAAASKWRRLEALVAGLSVSGAVRYKYFEHRFAARRPDASADAVFRVHPRVARTPVLVRLGTSDFSVFRQIFIEREYACLDDLAAPQLIFDCGANTGYSSVYFLSVFPQCHIVAVEPETGNFAALERNLGPYADRVTLVRGGIWSRCTPLTLAKAPYRDGREWTAQVRTCEPGEPPAFEGFDVGTLLTRSGRSRISLLKMDIEGAEVEVFANGSLDWLDAVDAIAIELHDDTAFGSATEVFHRALQGRGFLVTRSGELTICRRASGRP
jgi:FkbM family methyltransferase